MAEITAKMVKELREKSSAPMMLCKKALEEADGDIDKAIVVLRKKGIQRGQQRAGKDAAEGYICLYTHGFGRIGVMVEVCCETDFAVKSPDFVRLSNIIAMHIAWANPRWISSEDVSEDALNQEKEIMVSQIPEEKKKFAEKILEGKFKKFYAENCLMHQKELKASEEAKEDITIGDLVAELSGKLGEKVSIKRFTRYELGEE
jgi:elongation factor Ts